MLGVTGSTGELGGRVARRLADRGLEQRLIVSDPARAPELAGAETAVAPSYGDTEAMRAALEGVSTLYLVSGREQKDRLAEHLSAVEAAAAAGVERIVYTSFIGAAPDATFVLARQHHATEEAIRAAGVGFTFLRSGVYLDFVPFFAQSGAIRGPAGEGRTAPAARDDIADAAVGVLTAAAGGAAGSRHDGATYTLTGPEALTMAELAAILSEVSGVEVEFVDETVEQAWESRRPSGAPDWEIEGWVTTYTAIAAGEQALVTGDVLELAGHEPATVERWLREHPESWSGLPGSGAT